MKQTMTHHEVFALAGYATTGAYKALKVHDDILSAVHVSIELENSRSHHVFLSAYYKRDGSPNVGDRLDQLVEHGSELWNMPLFAAVWTREEVDRAMQQLHVRCDRVRGLLANNPVVEDDAA